MYSTQRASDTFIDAIVHTNQRNIITPQEAIPILWQVLDEDLEGHSLVNTDGEITEASANDILVQLLQSGTHIRWGGEPTSFAARPSSLAAADSQRFGAVNITLSGGVLTNTVLVPAVAGKIGYVMPYALWASDDDEYNLIFQDEDDAPLNPTNCTTRGINVELKHDNEISPIVQTHGVAGDNSGSSSTDIAFYGIAVNKALEVDVSGGSGSETLALWFKFWYE